MTDAKRHERPPLVKLGAGLLESVAMGLMVALVLSIFYAVVAREVFKLSVPWAEEVAAGLLAWSVMLGAASAWGQRRHIVIDVLLQLPTMSWDMVPNAGRLRKKPRLKCRDREFNKHLVFFNTTFFVRRIVTESARACSYFSAY